MNIALIGYGKMGKEIEKIALERGHQVPVIIDKGDSISKLEQGVDVAIEFTQPCEAVSNILGCFKHNVPVVVGTTGWYDAFDEVVKECEAEKGGVFYATNFSVGVNILFHVNKMLANIMSKQPDYKAHLNETHHIHKKDSPSGTAITLAEGLIENHDAYTRWEEGKADSLSKDTLPIEAFRENEVPGIHEMVYESDIDYIQIKHSAKSRKGFALGSVLAAEYMAGKHGVHTMNDLLNFNS